MSMDTTKGDRRPDGAACVLRPAFTARTHLDGGVSSSKADDTPKGAATGCRTTQLLPLEMHRHESRPGKRLPGLSFSRSRHGRADAPDQLPTAGSGMNCRTSCAQRQAAAVLAAHASASSRE